VNELYKEALILDPVAIEVSAQFAQLKSMVCFEDFVYVLVVRLVIFVTMVMKGFWRL
jgi:hypothetical protein